jgi:cytochrome b involved in lipid metabolism
MADVALHANAKSCWSAINGNVYDFTSYIPRHPGGERKILDICGKDGSSAFEGKHGEDTKPEKMLESLRIGLLL